MTNGDYIRQMDDETLARFLRYAEGGCIENHPIDAFKKDMEQYSSEYQWEHLKYMRDWVKEEVKA